MKLEMPSPSSMRPIRNFSICGRLGRLRIVAHSSASGFSPAPSEGLGAVSISGQAKARNQAATSGPTIRSGSCSALDRPSIGTLGSEKQKSTMNKVINAPT